MNFGVSAYTSLAQMSADASAVNAARNHPIREAAKHLTGDAVSKTAQLRELKKAATQFEAMLLEKWWSAMKKSGLGNDDRDGDPGQGTLDTIGMQAMSMAVANAGGIGIAAMLVRSVQRELAAEHASRAPAAADGPKESEGLKAN